MWGTTICGKPRGITTRAMTRPWTESELDHQNLISIYLGEWVYEVGPQRFMQLLVSENGRLAREPKRP